MERRMSTWWLALFWIPVIALVFGLLVGCASEQPGRALSVATPTKADLRRLVAQELDADSPFDTFAASANTEAAAVAAIFRPVVADVTAHDCRAAAPESIDCTLEVILQFPAMGGRESHTTLERRLRHGQGGWHLITQMP